MTSFILLIKFPHLETRWPNCPRNTMCIFHNYGSNPSLQARSLIATFNDLILLNIADLTCGVHQSSKPRIRGLLFVHFMKSYWRLVDTWIRDSAPRMKTSSSTEFRLRPLHGTGYLAKWKTFHFDYGTLSEFRGFRPMIPTNTLDLVIVPTSRLALISSYFHFI